MANNIEQILDQIDDEYFWTKVSEKVDAKLEEHFIDLTFMEWKNTLPHGIEC